MPSLIRFHCTRFRIRVNTKQEKPLKEQVHSLCETPSAYLVFKRTANLDKTLKEFNENKEQKRAEEHARIVQQAQQLLATKPDKARRRSLLADAKTASVLDVSQALYRSTVGAFAQDIREGHGQSPQVQSSPISKRDEPRILSSSKKQRSVLNQTRSQLQNRSHANWSTILGRSIDKTTKVGATLADRRRSTELEKAQLLQRSSHLKVKSLLEASLNEVASKDSIKNYISHVKERMLKQRLSSDSFLKVSSDIAQLKDQRPEFIPQFFELQKLVGESLSQEKVKARKEYEMSRKETIFWRRIEDEKRRKISMIGSIRAAAQGLHNRG